MRYNNLTTVFIFILMGLCTAPAGTQDGLGVMTYNIRYDNPGDGKDAWPHRKDRVAGLIRFHGADVVGLQEALHHQIADLDSLLPGFDWIGVGRDDGKMAGEFSPLFYRADRLNVEAWGTFWLSESPDQPGSIGWDAAITRLATWARFTDLHTGKVFWAFNTHFDHRGEQARIESARLIREKVTALAGSMPVVVMGDFNKPPESEAYRQLVDPEVAEVPPLVDAFSITLQPPYGPDYTWTTFSVANPPGRRIDYVFVQNQVTVRRHGILTDQWAGHYPSDHLPVFTEIALP